MGEPLEQQAHQAAAVNQDSLDSRGQLALLVLVAPWGLLVTRGPLDLQVALEGLGHRVSLDHQDPWDFLETQEEPVDQVSSYGGHF